MKYGRVKFSKKNNSNSKSIPSQLTSKYSSINSNLIQKDNYLKKNWQSCLKCEGISIPISNCIFCKRTSSLACTKCNQIRQMESHKSCRILLSFGLGIKRKYPKRDYNLKNI